MHRWPHLLEWPGMVWNGLEGAGMDLNVAGMGKNQIWWPYHSFDCVLYTSKSRAAPKNQSRFELNLNFLKDCRKYFKNKLESIKHLQIVHNFFWFPIIDLEISNLCQKRQSLNQSSAFLIPDSSDRKRGFPALTKLFVGQPWLPWVRQISGF